MKPLCSQSCIHCNEIEIEIEVEVVWESQKSQQKYYLYNVLYSYTRT